MNFEYLEAKRHIDDRAVNRMVWDLFLQGIERFSVATPGPLRIAEVGAGSGTLIDRLARWGFFERAGKVAPAGIVYHCWEQNGDMRDAITNRVASCREIGESEVFIEDVTVAKPSEPYDIVLAHAVLDLFSPQTLVDVLFRLLRPGGLLYAPIVFDGMTVFEPPMEDHLDGVIIDRYHRSMTSGGYARRHIQELPQQGFTVLGAGSSDWVVLPQPGFPRAEEVTLLGEILNMVERSVGEQLGTDQELTDSQLQRWLRVRRDQVDRGELFFEAHQLDLLVER